MRDFWCEFNVFERILVVERKVSKSTFFETRFDLRLWLLLGTIFSNSEARIVVGVSIHLTSPWDNFVKVVVLIIFGKSSFVKS